MRCRQRAVGLDRSRTIEQARNSVDQRWLILILAINGPLQLLNAVRQHHEEIWLRSMLAVLGDLHAQQVADVMPTRLCNALRRYESIAGARYGVVYRQRGQRNDREPVRVGQLRRVCKRERRRICNLGRRAGVP